MLRRWVPTWTILPVFLTAAQEFAGVVHGVRGGLFDVGIAAGFDGFDPVQGVLEVGGGDEDGVDILAGVELVVVADGIDFEAADFLDVASTLFAAAVPDVGDGDELEVHLFRMLAESGDESALHAVAATHDGGSDTIVGPDDGGVAFGIP